MYIKREREREEGGYLSTKGSFKGALLSFWDYGRFSMPLSLLSSAM